ncbi:prepilin-type N-terminal cleavage/methylation domain-containing protein [Demequina sp. SYSU T00039]|uniref:Prepilin-type N-terminal cleavage/methylation domain-containing protein n=1 Tax=Demequina lignilytica TaxID=3051663 RepID=A0AAW7LZK8_9MICO|nr:prepilin-type N-terminal cleavage/methylation domain-containing protein [Demequina sp. SYSU T00039]MDN4486709.1 prepilin-type N-terminal cleavage/methylation domain-containing protein [Demequina sp. SYSU T00039]
MRAARGDEGFTLVEFIVYIIILAIVMVVAGTFLIQTLVQQQHVKDTAEAADASQLAFKALETDMRSASWAITAQGGDLVVLQTRVVGTNGVDQERCVGYYLDQTDRQLHRWSSTSGVETKAALAAPNAASAASVAADWRVVASAVEPGSVGQAFTPVGQALGRGETVTMSLEAETSADWPAVVFEKSVSLRPQSSAILDCF